MLRFKTEVLQNTTVLTLLVLSAGLNVVLAHKVKSEHRAIEILKAEGRLQPGARVPDIEGKTPDGGPMSVKFASAGKPTILYVFAPSCHWCQRNFENMTALSRSVDAHYAFVGISLRQEGVAKYVEEHKIQYPVITSVPESLKTIYKMGGTPTTILVSTENQVIKVWSGAYDGGVQREVENYFHTRLPGLAPEQRILARN